MISSLHRPTLAKVDLSAISENIEQVVSHIPKQVKTFAVVKAMLMVMVLSKWPSMYLSRWMVFVFPT